MRNRFKIIDDRIIFSCNKINLLLLVFPIYLFVSGVELVLGLLPFEEGYTVFDVFVFVFACVWTAVVGWMIFYLIYDIFKTTVLDLEGVTVKFLSYTKKIEWREIKDYGISYFGKAKGDGNMYHLYFATVEQKQKTSCKKKLKGNMVKVTIMHEDYQEVIESVIPFCQTKTSVVPFIGEDKFHLI